MRYYLVFLIVLFFVFTSCEKKVEIKPSDFDAFWKQSVKELNKIPLEFKSTGKDTILNGKMITQYKIRSFNNIYFYAWVSEPVKKGKYPVMIRFSGLGESNLIKNNIEHLWFLKQDSFINMLVDVRGQGISIEQINPEDFITEGLKDKENFIYRGAFMDAVRSVDFIYNNSNNDGNIIVSGGSQGGTLSIVAAALNKNISICIASFPFLTDIPDYDNKKWPMKIWLHMAKTGKIDYYDLKETLSYFDMLNFSELIDVPVFIRSEEFDEITPPKGAIKLYNAIKNKKKVLFIEPCKGHGCSSNSSVANELEKTFIQNILSAKKN